MAIKLLFLFCFPGAASSNYDIGSGEGFPGIYPGEVSTGSPSIVLSHFPPIILSVTEVAAPQPSSSKSLPPLQPHSPPLGVAPPISVVTPHVVLAPPGIAVATVSAAAAVAGVFPPGDAAAGPSSAAGAANHKPLSSAWQCALSATSMTANKRRQAARRGKAVPDRPQRALFCFTLKSPIRKLCIDVVEWK